MTRPTNEAIKSSYQLWVQYIDANTRLWEFESMSESYKDSWLELFGA